MNWRFNLTDGRYGTVKDWATTDDGTEYRAWLWQKGNPEPLRQISHVLPDGKARTADDYDEFARDLVRRLNYAR